MALTARSFQLIEAHNAQAQRLRYMLAKLYGANIDIEMRGFLLQANEEELTCWIGIQQAFYATQGDNLRLKDLAHKAHIEYQCEQAFAEGRHCAYQLAPAEVAERGVQLRETKNPYRHNEAIDPQVTQAWTDGFQNAFEVIAGESW